MFSNGKALRRLGLAAVLASACRGEQAIYSTFMMEVWGAGPAGLAAAMTVVGATVALSQACLVRPLVARLGARTALKVSYCASVAQRIVWVLCERPALMAFGLALGAPGFGADACLQQWAVAAYEAHAETAAPRGELSAALASLATIGVLCASKAQAALYAYGKARGLPGAPFALGALLSAGAFVLASAADRAAPEAAAKAD